MDLPTRPFLLRKMDTQALPRQVAHAVTSNYTVQYFLQTTPFVPPPQKSVCKISLNTLIGKNLTWTWTQERYCITCGRKSKKLFNSGHCYVCFTTLAQNDLCAVKPELCHLHHGTCRDAAWGETNCFIPHTVYLAISDKLKVGITRERHEKNRWMDQGAFLSRPIAHTPNRLSAGQVEVHLKSHFSDKTFWRNMLKTLPAEQEFAAGQTQLLDATQTALAAIEQLKTTQPTLVTTLLTNPATAPVHAFHFPLQTPPPSFQSFAFEKTPTFSDTLIGIKGQYLIFQTGLLNVRKFSGYLITLAQT